MIRRFTLLICFTFSLFSLDAQTLFQEDFETGGLPTEWRIETTASDGGWNAGSNLSLSSQSFAILSNGSSNIIATNDDDCNCNKSNDLLITPPIDLSNQTAAVLLYDAFYTDDEFEGFQEYATVDVSTDGGATWRLVQEIEGNADWTTHGLSLADFLGESSVQIGFRYNDGGGWLYGCAIDNVVVRVPANLDAELVDVTSSIYGEVGVSLPLKGSVRNLGGDTIKSLTFSYTLDGGTPVFEELNNLSVASLEQFEFSLPNGWAPPSTGVFDIDVRIVEVNGGMDEDESNNTGSFSPEVFEKVVVPNKIQEFVDGIYPEITEITGASFALNGPTDLDFFPILGRDQLWVLNQETEDTGGSTLMISDASAGPSDFDSRFDGNAWHFMSLPTAIAFSDDNFNFATAPGVQDANHSGGTFTGPTLWSSDLDVYAMPSGGNGSHLDMLHGSPMSMGIAHEVDNVFWIYDDWNKDIVRYDFVDDHGPGNAYHGDALVRRFSGIGIDADGDIPNHMIIDKETGWLYIVDNGNDRVFRLDINSGTSITPIPLINEALTEHSSVSNYNIELLISSGLDQPCGIEIIENRLLVGDYANGNIKVYDMDNGFEEIGVIVTGAAGLTGIKVGPEGNIWYTNRIENTVNKALPGDVSNIFEEGEDIQLSVDPNPTSGLLNVNVSNVNNNAIIQLMDVTGQQLMTMKQTDKHIQLDMSVFPNGVYFLVVKGETFSKTERIVLSK